MEKSTCTIVNLSASTDQPAHPKIQTDRSGWIKFGADNLFPQEIIAMNGKSPVNSSIVDSTVTYVCGKGVRDSDSNSGAYVGVPNSSESWDEVIEKLARDYKMFGGFYLQIVVNKGGTTVSLFHQDYSSVRIGQITETGRPLTFRISNDWTKTYGKYKPLELPVWPGSLREARKGENYIYHYWDYSPGLHYYSLPRFYPAVDYIRADGLLGPFYRNSIRNGFTPSVVVSMPSNPDEATKQDVQQKMESAFSGPQGASSIIILWGENDTVKPQITPFNASANADIYNNVEGIIFQKIVSAHRLSSPTLAGVSGGGNLSGNAAEIIDAYVLYNYTVIAQLRRNILDHLNRFTKINQTAPLVIDDLDVVARMQEQEQEQQQAESGPEEPAPATDPSPAPSTPSKNTAALRKKNPLRRLLQYLHKYIRRIPKPGGGYRYIYKEPATGRTPRASGDKTPRQEAGPETSDRGDPSAVRSPAARERAKYLGQMRPLLKKKVTQTIEGGKNIRIGFTSKGNKHIYSDIFGRAKDLAKSDLKNLDKALEKASYVKSSAVDKPRQDTISRFHYFKDSEKELYYNVAEITRKGKSRRTRPFYFLYSATGHIK